MKVLKIENNIGKYTKDGTNYTTIKDITKEDIKDMITYILYNDDIEYDTVSETVIISNPAEKIIYEKIHEKIVSLIGSKDTIVNSIDRNYSDLYSKYNLSIEEETVLEETSETTEEVDEEAEASN